MEKKSYKGWESEIIAPPQELKIDWLNDADPAYINTALGYMVIIEKALDSINANNNVEFYSRDLVSEARKNNLFMLALGEITAKDYPEFADILANEKGVPNKVLRMLIENDWEMLGRKTKHNIVARHDPELNKSIGIAKQRIKEAVRN